MNRLTAIARAEGTPDGDVNSVRRELHASVHRAGDYAARMMATRGEQSHPRQNPFAPATDGGRIRSGRVVVDRSRADPDMPTISLIQIEKGARSKS